MGRPLSFSFLCVSVFICGSLQAEPDGQALYTQHCASCHGADRLGGIGPAPLPGNLKRVKRDRVQAAVRDGITTRNIAVSSDGRYAMVANYLPHTLVLLDAVDLSPLRVIPVGDDSGSTSRVSAVYDAATLAEVKRIPMRKPSGKYNVWNKISHSEGTSH